MPVLCVPARNQVVQAGARAIVEEGSRSPEFDERGRVEKQLSLIEPACRPHIVGLQVGAQGLPE